MINHRWAGGAAALAIAASLTPAAHAQFTAADINGQVLDASGNPVAGVTVTITDTRTGRVARARTSSNGVFFESGLAVGGPYIIVAETADGEVRREGVRLQPSTNSITLAVESGDVVVVRAQRSSRLDLNNGVGSAFSSEDILSQPTVQRDLIATLNRDPLAQSGGEGNLSVAGANPRFNGLAINGALLQDDFGLSSSTYPTARSPINLDAIESASIVAADYSVFASGFTGGLVNAVTKSGTNEFHGSAFYYYRDESFSGDSPAGVDVDLAPFEEEEYGFTFGGPIIKDKLFFFVSYDEFDSSRGINFSDDDAEDGVSQRLFDGLNQVVFDTYGIDMGGRPGNVSAPTTSERFLGTLEWNINDDHRARVTYQSTEEGQLASISSLEFVSAWYQAPQEVEVYTAEVFSDWTPDFSTQFRVNYKDNSRDQICGNPDAGEIDIRLSADDLVGTPLEGAIDPAAAGGADRDVFLTGSCDRFRHANDFEDERLQFFSRADYTIEDHNISFGVEFENYELFNLFVQRSNGEFRFDSYDQLLSGEDVRIDYNNAPTNNANDAAAEWGFNKWSFTAQDQWQIIPELSVNFGLRYELYTQDDEPIDSASFQDEYGFSSAQNLDGLDLWQPRVGFEYNPFDGTKLTGGFGLFSGGNPQVWVSNAFQGLASNVRGNFDITSVSEIPQELQDEVAAITLDTFVPIDVISPDFEIPSDWKASLRLDQSFDADLNRFGIPLDLGTDYLLTLQVLHNRTKNGFLWRNLAQTQLSETQPTGVAPDGRIIYADLDALEISNVVALDNFDEGESTTFTATLAKEYDFGFGFQVSYAYQDVETVTPGTSSRGISNWRAITDIDRNFPSAGVSPFEVEHAFKIFFDYNVEIIPGLNTQFALFGDIQSGAPFTYAFNVDADNALFGRAGDGETPFDNNPVYIPTGPNDAAVVFASGFDQDTFFAEVDRRGLSSGIQARNDDQSPWNQFWDFHFEQDLPFADFGVKRFEGNRLKFVLDIENIGNLLNSEWGVFRDGPSNNDEALVSADLVSVADVAANGVDGATALEGDAPRTTCTTQGACVYRFNNFLSDRDTGLFPNTGDVELDRSFYSARIGIRYEW
ncbi:TonB-dependent receptor [Parvularcula maris]|uniref:TonB-dependent receptor n=1 Tax=Parvularcula maris TaxID=2965077 RepID=A0A9X2RL15_9PROT|nr:TonB-dependent receptor [Parvularcula maris]MCQ8186378.1 TonB-dependent receptor [Parvularcula maris]